MSKCFLCPRGCAVDRTIGETGVCECADTILVAHKQLHFWEEPPISGSRGSGTIFFGGCSLKCVYCQNAKISRDSIGKPRTPEELAFDMLELQDAGAHNINLVTPTHFAQNIREGLKIAKKQGLSIPIVWNTSGYETPEAIEENSGLVGIYLTDFKYATRNLALQLSNAADYREVAMSALLAMVRQIPKIELDEDSLMMRGVIVRHMVLPGQVEESKKVLKLVQDEVGSSVKFSIMNQYTPVIKSYAQTGAPRAKRILELYPDLARSVTSDEYEEVLTFADEIGIEDYFWQDGEAAKESFIPDFCVQN